MTSGERQTEEDLGYDDVLQQLQSLSTHDHGADAEQEQDHDDEVAESSTRFVSSGELPAVEQEMPHPPAPERSASERAYRNQRGQSPAPLPADALRVPQDRMLYGVRIHAPAGTRPLAISAAGAVVAQLVGHNPGVQQRLAAARTTLVIIPANKPMTDLPQFASLRNQKTPACKGDRTCSRAWSAVRGSGGMQAPDGSFAIGVAEENLISYPGVKNKYVMGYVGMHELAHAVESKGLSPQQQVRLSQLYQLQRKTDRNDFTDDYAATNQHEYFANSTNAFFGTNAYTNPKAPKKGNSAAWLAEKDPDMYAFLVEIYGAPR